MVDHRNEGHIFRLLPIFIFASQHWLPDFIPPATLITFSTFTRHEKILTNILEMFLFLHFTKGYQNMEIHITAFGYGIDQNNFRAL